PPRKRNGSKKRLRETVEALNSGQSPLRIRFHADGTGEGIWWEVVASVDMDKTVGTCLPRKRQRLAGIYLTRAQSIGSPSQLPEQDRPGFVQLAQRHPESRQMPEQEGVAMALPTLLVAIH